MRGISEERLIEILNSHVDYEKLEFLLLNECKELNPWKPIETVPKNKTIIIYCSLQKQAYTSWWDGECYMYDGGDLPSPISQPELWQELPEDPK